MATFESNRRKEKSGSVGYRCIFLVLVANCQIVATSVTWTAPPPAWTQTDSNDIRIVDMRVVNGSTQVHLRWNYTLSPGSNLQVTTFFIDDGITSDDIGILTTSGVPAVNNKNDYQTRFAISASDVATLIINRVTEREEATYQCKLTVIGNSWTYNIRVIVTVPVNITESPDQTGHEGSNITLFCKKTGRPTPNITWTKVLEDGSNGKVLHRGQTWDFPNISRTASGTYRCTADNGVENPVSRKVKVNVTYPPKIIKLAREYEVATQESLTLGCQAEGNPQPTYTWTPCEPQKSVCDNSKLNIPEARNSSVYTFTCKVSNYLGNDARNTSVFIASDVINVTLVITSESCTVGKYDEALWGKLSKKIDEVFANEIGYKSAQLKDIRCGSVIVDLALKFGSTVRGEKVISILQDAVKNKKLGDFNVSAIVGTRDDTETATMATTPTSPHDGTKTLIIVLAVLGSVLVIAVVGGVVACCVYKKRKCKKKDTKVHNNESQVQATGNVQGEYAEANPGYVIAESNRNSTDVNPVTYDTVGNSTKKGKRDVVEENPTVSYAVVDKSKKKKREKKPKPGELQYAELAEFSRPQEMPKSSTSHGSYPTETQYADVNAM